ncbi:MAG: hypothetical protein BGP04_14180 [Rhizobiales bacterium 62-17]|nr:hypothetical protein [Hyphomicrobiales bacterium]OJY04705.1 MAG: hypothetical protein BGP04_14180 [Rhizobiales bacterium 62-17]
MNRLDVTITRDHPLDGPNYWLEDIAMPLIKSTVLVVSVVAGTISLTGCMPVGPGDYPAYAYYGSSPVVFPNHRYQYRYGYYGGYRPIYRPYRVYERPRASGWRSGTASPLPALPAHHAFSGRPSKQR